MKKPAKPKPLKLDENKLWQKANEIAEKIYNILPDLPEEEKWTTQTKLRSTANDLLWSVAQGVSGGTVPAGLEYDWNQARKQAGTLKTMYRFAGRQEFIEIDPHLMIKIEDIIKEIDVQVQEAYRLTQENNARELDLYRERVRLWKKANEEPENKK